MCGGGFRYYSMRNSFLVVCDNLDNRASLVLHFTKSTSFLFADHRGRRPRYSEACVDRIETPPDVVIRRLPLYARSLRYLLQEGVTSVSSQELGDRINVTAAQIRKDLSYFGEFGKQGIGYDVEKLLGQIEHILGLTQEWAVALVGIGHLGEAIARYEGFRSQGIRIVALFDSEPAKIGTTINGQSISGVDQIESI